MSEPTTPAGEARCLWCAGLLGPTARDRFCSQPCRSAYQRLPGHPAAAVSPPETEPACTHDWTGDGVTEATADGLVEAVEQAILDVAVDHPMWIGDDGKPLDYLPERERLLGDFVREAAAAATRAAVAQVRAEAEEREARVRAVHFRRPWRPGDMRLFGQTKFPDLCDHCYGIAWPCATGRALGDE